MEDPEKNFEEKMKTINNLLSETKEALDHSKALLQQIDRNLDKISRKTFFKRTFLKVRRFFTKP